MICTSKNNVSNSSIKYQLIYCCKFYRHIIFSNIYKWIEKLKDKELIPNIINIVLNTSVDSETTLIYYKYSK